MTLGSRRPVPARKRERSAVYAHVMNERERFVPQRVGALTDALCRRENALGAVPKASARSERRRANPAISGGADEGPPEKGSQGVAAESAASQRTNDQHHSDQQHGKNQHGKNQHSQAASSDNDDPERFRSFSRLVSGLFHFEFYDREQQLLSAWEQAPHDSDAANLVSAEVSGLLDAAGYTAVSMAELAEALDSESLIPLKLHVDLEDYDELLIYRRGGYSETIEIKKLLGLRSESKTITVDERVVIHTRVKPQSWFEDNGIDASERNLKPGSIELKQFQQVPRADIEMLLPSTQVKFRLVDSLMIGVPAFAGGVVVLATKLLATLGLVLALVGALVGVTDDKPIIDQSAMLILLGGAMAIGSFMMKQWTKLKNRKVDYLKTLSENLYFRTLANGPGVIHTMLSSAEQQEVAEVLLGYHFLLDHPSATIGQLDRLVEEWLATETGVVCDFDVEDSVAKLRALQLVSGLRRLRAVPVGEGLVLLDRRWDDIFQHPGDESDVSALLGTTDAPALVRLRRIVGRFRGGAADRQSVRE